MSTQTLTPPAFTPHVAPWLEKSTATWIWPAAAAAGPNQYADFAQEFKLDEGQQRELKIAISADSNYAIWLNGQFAGFGQWSNWPDDKTYDVIDLAPYARAGANRLCIVGYHQGEDSSTYRAGAAGVVFAVAAGDKVVAQSGADTRARISPGYVSGSIPKVTGQLGFTFEHRGDREDDWKTTAPLTAEAGWAAVSTSATKELSTRPVRPRPVEKLSLEPRLPMKVVSQGAFSLAEGANDPAQRVQHDLLGFKQPAEVMEKPVGTLEPTGDGIVLKPESWKSATGPFLVLDCGHEETGLLDLELEAPAGTVIDIGYGEHLEDLRVRALVGGRHFAVRHVCGSGPQHLLHPFLRLGMRYLQLHITPASGHEAEPIRVRYAGVRPTPYPVKVTGSLSTGSALHDKIYEVSRRTLALCMHEHYEDCPWREQALYAMDSRNQALAGYYCFSNYEFPRASIHLLGQGLDKETGFLELCAPARVSITIPSFSLAWILMLNDYLLYSGDRDFVKAELPVVRQLLERCASETSGTLMQTPRGKRMWNFYEWAPGLEGHISGEPTDAVSSEAPLNLFYLLALEAAARMENETGGNGTAYQQRADALRPEIASNFWDGGQKAIVTRIGAGATAHFAELTQSLALLAHAVPANEEAGLRKRLASDNNGLVPCTISHTIYKFEALLAEPDTYGARVGELIDRDWGYMLYHGATSFWETIDGASAFGDAGSLCHGWSGVPAYIYGKYGLGVVPASPGFSTYEVKPVKSLLPHSTGAVPMPGQSALAVPSGEKKP